MTQCKIQLLVIILYTSFVISESIKVSWEFVPSWHTTSWKCCYDVVLVFWRRFNVHTTSFERRVPAGFWWILFCVGIYSGISLKRTWSIADTPYNRHYSLQWNGLISGQTLAGEVYFFFSTNSFCFRKVFLYLRNTLNK